MVLGSESTKSGSSEVEPGLDAEWAEMDFARSVGITGGNCMQLGLDVFVVVWLSLDV
jgi:hypothetical protein